MQRIVYTVRIEPCEEGGYWAHVPALPGCYTQGETLDEVKEMAKEAIEAFLASLVAHGEPIPTQPSRRRGYSLPIEVGAPVIV